MNDKKILGSFEVVGFPELNVKGVIAKIDTGAYSGALHATHVQEIAGADGIKRLEFYPLGRKNLKTSVEHYSIKPVKSSGGHVETRYVIRTSIIVRGETQAISISLADRSSMMKHVLIGRQFLRRYGYLVDVRKGMKHRYTVKDLKS